MSASTATATAPAVAVRPSYRHLARMTTRFGVFEHALLDAPRREHGFCVDDVARALTTVVRAEPTAELTMLADIYLTFLEGAVTADGAVHNRRDVDGHWTDVPALGDWWGRALGALGAARVHAPLVEHRARAGAVFERAAARRSPDVRASAFAALGAIEVLRAEPTDDAARALLVDALAVIPIAARRDWDWPEARLRYANATLCEALIAGGDLLGRTALRRRGLDLLAFLLAVETGPSGALSPTGSAGRGPADAGPLWDQQAIEVAALADACVAADAVTDDPRWREGLRRSWEWFLGRNDVGVPIYDIATGAGYDGLQPGGRNGNRGAESTLAALTTLQHAIRLGVA